nr:MAG TPA: hypothetical protein [Caudoviricetes sp.]
MISTAFPPWFHCVSIETQRKKAKISISGSAQCGAPL